MQTSSHKQETMKSQSIRRFIISLVAAIVLPAALDAQLCVSEPFAYAAVTLEGAFGDQERGFDGPWIKLSGEPLEVVKDAAGGSVQYVSGPSNERTEYSRKLMIQDFPEEFREKGEAAIGAPGTVLWVAVTTGGGNGWEGLNLVFSERESYDSGRISIGWIYLLDESKGFGISGVGGNSVLSPLPSNSDVLLIAKLEWSVDDKKTITGTLWSMDSSTATPESLSQMVKNNFFTEANADGKFTESYEWGHSISHIEILHPPHSPRESNSRIGPIRIGLDIESVLGLKK
jgi:hypothetical protein